MKTSLYAAIIAIALFGLLGSVYVVREDQTALVLNLGRVARADIKPGLHFKVPLVESVRVFDRRFRTLETAPERYLTLERKDVSIDFFAVGYISDVRAFYRATGGDEKAASDRLAPIITDSLRNEINSRTLQEAVSGDRAKIVGDQLALINRGAANLGINITDLRIKRIDLPEGGKVIADVYARMSAQRFQVASRLRAEGEEQAQKIRSQADREQAVIAAEAERDAQILRGEGDATAASLYAEAAQRDPGFYSFHRSLEAYRNSFSGGDSVIVLDRDDPFLQYLKSDR